MNVVRLRIASAALPLLLAACTASVVRGGGDAGGSGSDSAGVRGRTATGGAGQPPSAGSAAAADPHAAGPMPLRRLTRTEYDNTVRDLLGDSSAPAQVGFPPEERADSGFFKSTNVSGVEVSRYADAAESLAATAVANRFAQLVPCDPGSADEACATRFIAGFGQRAFRRPLTDAEKAEHLALYRALRAAPIGYDHKTAIQTLLAAMLQSPRFLYHWELDPRAKLAPDGDVVALSPYQVASRLSYFLWQSMPDDALLAAAAAGRLNAAADVKAQARRLLSDARAKDTVSSFVRQVIETDKLPTLEKDTGVYPLFDRALAQSMVAETDAFARWAILEDGKLDTLLTSSTSFVDQRLAKLYGVPAPAGSGVQKVALDGRTRFGLLTHASFLSVQANTYEPSPVRRGKVLLFRFLCGAVPPPPPDVDLDPKPLRPNPQTREKFEDHESSPTCAGCHKAMDPLGFAFEGYDGIGAARTTDAGRPVATKGSYELDGTTVSFDGARELVTAMAASDQARSCFARQWLRYAVVRDDVDADAASIAAAYAAFREAKLDVRELLVALTTTRTFLFRSISQGEVL